MLPRWKDSWLAWYEVLQIARLYSLDVAKIILLFCSSFPSPTCGWSMCRWLAWYKVLQIACLHSLHVARIVLLFCSTFPSGTCGWSIYMLLDSSLSCNIHLHHVAPPCTTCGKDQDFSVLFIILTARCHKQGAQSAEDPNGTHYGSCQGFSETCQNPCCSCIIK